MKTRIITGAVITAIVAAAAVAVHFVPELFQVFASIIGAACMVEVLYNTNLAKKLPLLISASVFCVASQYLLFLDFAAIAFCYLLVLIVLAVFMHEKISFNEICYAYLLPVYISYALRSLLNLLVVPIDGLFLLFILLSVTSIADIGAYFTGVLIGQHKMTPVISPKKTYEGLVGGLLFGEVAVFLVCFVFHAFGYITVNYLASLLFAPVLILAGVAGDLFASLIKRHANIKDYGNIFPGHGGFMDRLDSIFAAAPLLLLFNGIISFSGI